MAAFNYDDPRFQRDLQRARAQNLGGPKRLDRPITGRVVGAHAAHQLGRQQQFEGLHLSKKMADTRYDLNKALSKQRDRRLGLGEDRLDWRRSTFDRDIEDQNDALNFSIASGLLGTGFSIYEGRRRESAIAQEAERTEQFRQSIVDYMNKNKKPSVEQQRIMNTLSGGL